MHSNKQASDPCSVRLIHLKKIIKPNCLFMVPFSHPAGQVPHSTRSITTYGMG